MLTVHHLERSRSERVLWLLEELGLEYEVVGYRRSKRYLAPKELKAVHPLGKAPVLTDGGITIAESGAIIEYVLSHYGEGRLIPPANQADELLRFKYWLHYAEGSLMPLLVMALVLSKVTEPPTPWLARGLGSIVVNGISRAWTRPQLQLQLGFVESELGKAPWFAGSEFSAADIQMSLPLILGKERANIHAGSYPNIVAWLARISARPAFQRAHARGERALPSRGA